MNYQLLPQRLTGKEKFPKMNIEHSATRMKDKVKNIFLWLLPILFLTVYISSCDSFSQAPVAKISNPDVSDVAQQFDNPPAQYSLTFYWGWDGNVTEEVIKRDLDEFKSKNVQVVTVEPGYNLPNPYLSDGWFKNVKTAVDLAKERNMKVYLVDEGKYPSGFAGGKIVNEVPELTMKVLMPDTIMEVNGGGSVSIALSDEIVSAAAYNKTNHLTQVLAIKGGKLVWTAPEGDWQIFLVKHAFQSSPTRSVNNPTHGKDRSNALIDYLDSEATGKFIEFTHENYKKYMGEEFGSTILGFRGDEPDYSTSGIPWTPDIFAEFENKKGYDVRPYVAAFFANNLTEEQQRVKADYWDVWSTLFANNFFKVQADWCAKNNLNYLVHLNHEDDMAGLVRSEGDFFKDMSSVEMPGVDAIWHQIWPGEENPVYPKYASSSAHVNGHLRSFTESFAAYNPQPDLKQAKWILDQQLVRGINMVEVMYVSASTWGRSGMRGWLSDDNFPKVAKYVQRASYLLSQGVPAAQVAVLFPTTSIWLGDNKADSTALSIMQELLKKQHDFDIIEEQAFDSTLILQDGIFYNKSGQGYSTIIIPPVRAISGKVIKLLEAFENSGGKVISFGNQSVLTVGKTFRDASVTDLNWTVNEPTGKLTKLVLEALPPSDFILDKPSGAINYNHRKWNNADLYFIFNEGNEQQEFNVTLSGKGKVQVWDAMNGQITEVSGEKINGKSVLTGLQLEPWETKFIVVGKM